MSAFADKGGVALFGRPETEMKCAGAPLKYAFLTDDVLRRRGNRGKAELIYNAPDHQRCSACRSWPRRCACCSPTAALR
jgi:hypothetical protein